MSERGRSSALAAAAMVLAVGLRSAYAWYGNLAYDEYQHMHAAFLVAQGQTPFVDFFEHHTPLFYYFAAALIPLKAPNFDTLLLARIPTLVFHIATIGLAALWVRALHGSKTAVVVAVLMTGNVCLFLWGTRTYLDPYAAPFLIGVAWLLSTRSASAWRWAAAGTCLSLAALITQKAGVVGLAVWMILILQVQESLRIKNQERRWLSNVAWMLGGAVVPLCLLLLLMSWDGVLAMIRDALLLNLRWKARHFPRRELMILAATDAFVYAAAFAGLAHDAWRLLRQRLCFEPRDTPSLFLIALMAGIFLQPVVWEEYFILVIPFAVVVAGVTLTRWWERLTNGAGAQVGMRLALAALFVVTSLMDLVALRLAPDNPLSIPAIAFITLLWAGVGLALITALQRHEANAGTLALAVVLISPVIQQIDWIPRHRNDEDRARVEYVMANTRPDEAVFDGRSGYGVFRPHAYRYWFLHDEMQLMLSEKEKTIDIIAALAAPKTRIAIVDDYTGMLPTEVRDYITANYDSTPFNDLRIRR